MHKKWTEFISRTTLHGLSELDVEAQEKEQWSKTERRIWIVLQAIRLAFWALIWLTCAALAVYQIRALMIAFIDTPHWKSEISYSVDFESASEFPSVVVCNYNRVNQTKADQLGLSNHHLSSLFAASMGVFNFDMQDVRFESTESYEIAYEWEQYYKSTHYPYTDVAHLHQLLAHSCEETLIQCKVGEGRMFNCCAFATPVFTSMYGLCYALRVPAPWWQGDDPNEAETERTAHARAGPQFGLRLWLNVAPEHYLRDTYYYNMLSQGLVLSVTYDPKSPYLTRPISVSPGSSVEVAMKPEITKYEQSPWPQLHHLPCRSDVSHDKDMDVMFRGHMNVLSAKYSENNCRMDCQQQVLYRRCQCTMLAERLPEFTQPTCNYSIFINNCFYQALADLFPSYISLGLDGTAPDFETPEHLAYSECEFGCAPSCHSTRGLGMSVQLNKNHFSRALRKPGELLSNRLFNRSVPFTDEQIHNLIVANVYFLSTEPSVVAIVEKVKLFDFVANVGGQLGLWLGASIITLIHAVYYWSAVVINAIVQRIRQKRD